MRGKNEEIKQNCWQKGPRRDKMRAYVGCEDTYTLDVLTLLLRVMLIVSALEVPYARAAHRRCGAGDSVSGGSERARCCP